MLLKSLSAFSIALLAAGAAQAQPITDKAEVETLLNGRTMVGIYLRNHAPYKLVFGTDGILLNQDGSEGRWWVDDDAHYCRRWTSGQLEGNEACFRLVRGEGETVSILFDDRKVAQGLMKD